MNRLGSWSNKWQLKFNTEKCKIMHVSRKKDRCTNMYSMYGTILEETEEEKYLGITISNRLTWTSHVNNIVCGANRKLGIIRRNFKACDRPTKNLLYNQVVRSSLEYCNSVLDPYCKNQIILLEKLQKRAAKYVTGQSGKTYCELLNELGWLSLHQRRVFSKQVM